MANFKRIARKLELEDEGEAAIGDKVCPDCNAGLRFGRDGQGYTWSYCPECKKKIQSVLIPRFPPAIKVLSHSD
jgi:predicted amidophosphoribosyltransferase